MTFKDDRAEKLILEYQAKLEKIDALYERAHDMTASLAENAAAAEKLKALGERRSELEKQLEHMKTLDIGHWREDMIESAGPLAIWDIVAQQLEDFIERHE